MQITSDIPLPANALDGRRSGAIYSRLEVGESFFVAGQDSQGKMASAAKRWARRQSPPRVIVARKDGEGVRIWRAS